MTVAHDVLDEQFGAVHLELCELRRHDLWGQWHGALDGKRIHTQLLGDRKRLLDHLDDAERLDQG